LHFKTTAGLASGADNTAHLPRQWHADTPNCIYQFYYDSHRQKYIDLDLYNNTCVAGTLNHLKP